MFKSFGKSAHGISLLEIDPESLLRVNSDKVLQSEHEVFLKLKEAPVDFANRIIIEIH